MSWVFRTCAVLAIILFVARAEYIGALWTVCALMQHERAERKS